MAARAPRTPPGSTIGFSGPWIFGPNLINVPQRAAERLGRPSQWVGSLPQSERGLSA